MSNSHEPYKISYTFDNCFVSDNVVRNVDLGIASRRELFCARIRLLITLHGERNQMGRYPPSSENSGKQNKPTRSNMFYGGLIVMLMVLLAVIVVIFYVLFTNPSFGFFSPSHQVRTVTPLATTYNLNPSITYTTTPTSTFTATSTATASVTPLPTRTLTVIPSRTPKPTKPTNTPRPTRTPKTSVIKNSSYRITYQSWLGFQRTKAYKNGLRCSSEKGQVITFTTPVESKKIAILFFKGPDQGKARIFIDGKAKETIDLHKESKQFQFERTYTGLSNKKHTIQVIVLGNKNANSEGFWVCVDGFIYNNNRVNDAYPWVTYGPWQTLTSNNNSTTYRVASKKGASFDFSFNGTAFIWVAAAGPEGGLAEIYVDNRFIKTVDLYSSASLWKKRIRIDDLGVKKHTVKIIVLGQRNPLSKGTNIYLNRILYY